MQLNGSPDSARVLYRCICGCPIWDLLCVSAPVWRPVQGPIARPPGFLPAPCLGGGQRTPFPVEGGVVQTVVSGVS